ncbi:transposase, partial [Geitlerinema sp. CS-897]|nr:transposase [Geitlerinema sp. CS-897]
MKYNSAYLKQWSQEISRHFPNLSWPQVSGLATWSFGMMMSRSSSLTQVSECIAQVNEEKFTNVRQRLQQWYKEKRQAYGRKYAELDV